MFTEALCGFSKEHCPFDWALTQNNLGATCYERQNGNKTDNLKTAILYYNEALVVQFPEFTPDDCAITITNLGISHKNIYSSGDREQSACKAISFFDQACSVNTKQYDPLEWANLQQAAAALRAAMLFLRKDARWYHPVYWAAFSHTGTFQPINN